MALKTLDNEMGELSIELAVDRDTLGVPGTPDIVESVFRKIDKAQVFVADISIINSETPGKPTPNPNVLLELGYAARSLGWDRIIAIYNLDYGEIENLPFDLEHRRPISYSLQKNTKAEAKKHISKIVAQNIFQLHQTGSLFDVVNDYLKVQVDTELLTIINHLHKMLLGYDVPRSLDDLSDLLSTRSDELRVLLSGTFIGFQIHKRWHINVAKLRKIADDAVSSTYYGKEIAAAIIELVRWVEAFENLNKESQRHSSPFKPLDEINTEFEAINGGELNLRNLEYPDRFVLLRNTKEGRQVKDFGDFVESEKIKNLTRNYKLSSDALDHYTRAILSFFTIANEWLELTNGELIVDESVFRAAD